MPDTVGQIGGARNPPDGVGKKRGKETADTVCRIRIEMGYGKALPPPEVVKEANSLLKSVEEGLQLH